MTKVELIKDPHECVNVCVCRCFECVNVSKSLGVMIDETLTWHCHVDLVKKKVNSGLYVLKRLRDLVDVEVSSVRCAVKKTRNLTSC